DDPEFEALSAALEGDSEGETPETEAIGDVPEDEALSEALKGDSEGEVSEAGAVGDVPEDYAPETEASSYVFDDESPETEAASDVPEDEALSEALEGDSEDEVPEDGAVGQAQGSEPGEGEPEGSEPIGSEPGEGEPEGSEPAGVGPVGAEPGGGEEAQEGEPQGEPIQADGERTFLSEDELLSDIDSFFGESESLTGGSGRKYYDEDSLLSDIGDLLDSGDYEDSISLDFSQSSREAVGEEAPDSPSFWPEKPDEETELGQLRKLLMERELTQLSYLSNVFTEPGNHAQALSQVITEAILLRSRKDDKLNTVLGPTVEKIVSASVRRNPETLANNIFPVIGPAIRRSIAETFTSMLQNFNSTLEMSLSLKGLKWRLEALRVRKPFSEIVMLHTLLYHVEEIYLIHASSGIVLDHLVYEGGESRDSDLVAGMFTAIQDFVKDSFSVGQGESLDNLRFGERIIFLRRADPVYMACVVRGNPPASLSQDLQEALELVVVECAEDLENFDGNTEPFKKGRHYFTDFLTVRYQDTTKKLPFLVRFLPFFAILLIIVAFFSSYYSNKDQQEFYQNLQSLNQRWVAIQESNKASYNRHFERALDLLRQEPGLVVTHVSQPKENFREVVVLRDILARDPVEILAEEGKVDPSSFEVISRPYVSLDEAIVDQRLKNSIEPLPTVTIDFNGQTGLLRLSGTAPLGWILNTRDKAANIPGVRELDASALNDPRTMEMEALISGINGVVVHFPINSDVPIPEDMPALVRAVDNIVALEKLATEMQMHVSLIIYGHADATGQDRRNFELSEQRTKTVAAMLYAKGSSIPISNYGLGSQFSARTESGPQEDQESRKIELRVRVTQDMF
ncbi:MAG: OmpA family protein, partial [Deltaproteobacteria bacterium]|nr:OmpA family protein [Deltaproteobacteria bacterium]